MTEAQPSQQLASMTAYGCGEASLKQSTYTCEIRSLNSRFIEVNVRLPRPLIALEIEIINHIKSALKRGKVDVFIDLLKSGGAKDLPQLDADAVAHYAELITNLEGMLTAKGIEAQHQLLSLNEVLSLEGVLASDSKVRSRTSNTDGAELHRPPVMAAVDAALAQLKAARRREGAALATALQELCSQLRQRLSRIAEQRGPLGEILKQTYLKRLNQLLQNVQSSVSNGSKDQLAPDDTRLIQEIAILLDKADIEEELTRLNTHIDAFEQLLQSEDSPGRKLDFLCQEMHREVNTISNKLVQTEVSQHTIEMKQIIERIRQQVQNLE